MQSRRCFPCGQVTPVRGERIRCALWTARAGSFATLVSLSPGALLIYITTPIYYVNDAPHIGHAFTTVMADALARYFRLKGEEVRLLTGTDEHGAKVARAAEVQGSAPLEWADRIVQRYIDAWELLDIGYDDFIRTTEPRHADGVRALLSDLHDRGDIYKDHYEGLYCVACEAYYTEAELVDGKCPIHGIVVEIHAEENYFFRLSRYAGPLLAHIERHPEFVYPAVRRNEVVGFVGQGLQDLSISRAQLTWGIPLPWDPTHVTYVWVDALMNYATAAGYGRDRAAFDRVWPPWVHLVGKDILRFHAVIWPALLMAAGLELPRQVAAHGFLLVGGEKMSKTRANQIDPASLVETFGPDGYRYHFLRDVTFGPDGSFSWEGMVDRYNADLANDFGNLVNRVLNMAERYREGRVPAVSGDGDLDAGLRDAARDALAGMAGFEEFRFSDALRGVWRMFGAANAFVESTEPWKLARDPADSRRLDEVLNALLETLRVGAVLISPVMPAIAADLWDRLGLDGGPADGPLAETARFATFPATTVTRGRPLFPRIEE